MSSDQDGGQPFSMHARGVSAMDSTTYLDFSYQMRCAVKELRDITGSAILFFYLQSWQAAFVMLITIGSVSFFTYVGSTGLGVNLNWTLVSFVVLLPSVLLLYLGYMRREQALREMAEVKTALLQTYWSYEGKSSHQPVVGELLLSFTDLLQRYLNTPRFYVRSYPLSGVTDKMTLIAQERARQSQQAMLIFRNLSQCPDETARGQWQAGLVVQLQNCYERLAVLKEFRLPQALRVLVRFFVVLIIPIFYGPYYANLSNNLRNFMEVLVFAVMMHLGMVAVMNAAIDFEDCFTTEGMDGVYVSESLYEVETIIKQGRGSIGTEGYGGDHTGDGKANGTHSVLPPVNSMAAHGRLDQHAVNMASLQPLPT